MYVPPHQRRQAPPRHRRKGIATLTVDKFPNATREDTERIARVINARRQGR